MKQTLALAERQHPHRPNETIIVSWAQSILDQQQYKELALDFIKANPTSWASLDMLVQPTPYLGPPQYHEVAPLYQALSPTLRNSAPGRAYGQLVQSLQAVALGGPAPDFA